MVRSLYAALVRLHPPAFRHSYGPEMLSIFDHTPSGSRAALVSDAAVSLLRQSLLRPEFREPENCARGVVAEAPMFHVLNDDPRLTPRQWLCGTVLSLLCFTAASFLIAHAGTLIVTAAPVANLLDGKDSNAELRLIAGYFFEVPVLSALDLSHDFIISADEIAKAPEALRSLDANGDGALDAEECGQVFAGDFMRRNPVLAALDANHDGIISAVEIANAPRALETLDRNLDGELSASEVLP